jgi:hypothetical protein
MADTIQDPVAPPSNLSEFRAAKTARAAESATPPVDKQAPAVEKSGTAGESANPTQETQGKTEQPKKKAQTADERAAELRAAGRTKEADKILADAAEKTEYEQWKAGKADREREKQELEELRASRNRQPPPAAQPSPATPAAQASADPTRPNLDEFLARPENKEKPYAKVVMEWKDADDDWKDRKRNVQSVADSQRKTLDETAKTLRSKHDDWDSVMTKDGIERAGLNRMIPIPLDLPHGLEVLYRLAKDPTKVRMIYGLSPTSQMIELGIMSRAVETEGQQPTDPPALEKPKAPPVSRTPPPARHSIGGIAPSEATPNGPPKGLTEHRARRDASKKA